MKKSFILLLAAIVFFIACNHRRSDGSDSLSLRNIQYDSIVVDTVHVHIENSSFIGFSGVQNNQLYYFDRYFGYYYRITHDGEVVGRLLGQGSGPGEIPLSRPLAINVSRDNQFLALGGTDGAYLFKDFKKGKKIAMRMSKEEKSYEDTRLYTYYSPLGLNLRMIEDRFYINVFSEADGFNPIEDSEEYYKKAHILMEVEIPTGNTKVIGNYSDFYKKNHDRVKHLISVLYDVDSKGDFYVSYQADSLIYCYDKDFKLLKSYGFSGSEMNTQYERILFGEPVGTKVRNDFDNKGYYYWFKYMEKQGLSFRSYQKGNHVDYDGLQVYRNETLIADLNIPKKFKVAGYIDPYFVTEIICDDETGVMKFYKFELKSKLP